ncbi:uncharacterized protein NECHADRAFT_82541 [Fusarium vanettenii 77-13-4]|uniref:Uncharacterized protein n=1 Tax=Fusarium vanettenii (strain ATCC MYA-4622 / CBS 123669 / FGSC 9596 / NRRL 45880 / 77-13-4) TaxID=660122 RepID=C7YXI5_FUSV7|nr:uncharacterized protein NECHADRAFT_82541 [Fusarium vanettenii 77-13-4]EEU43347.1 hypothetical protein NECHADRAFT_82541 [Fusarium vanettenii 77-13-4]
MISEQHTDVSSDEENRTGTREGPEYDYYYELKAKRSKRKEDHAVEKMKEKASRLEVRKSNQVKQIFDRIQKEEAEHPKKPYEKEDMFVRGKRFGLYSAEFVKYGYTGDSTDRMPRTVEFYHYPDVIYGPMPKSFRKPWYDDGELEGHVDIDSEEHHFQGLISTRRGGLKKLTVKTTKGEKLVFQFLDSDHLILRTSRDLAFADPRPGEDAAPETFVFYGIAEGESTGTPDMWNDEEEDSDDGYGWY